MLNEKNTVGVGFCLIMLCNSSLHFVQYGGDPVILAAIIEIRFIRFVPSIFPDVKIVLKSFID
jgi:hypothetical protein